ncbi:MAG: DUF1573 domain-containing protein [Chloroflexi bacterium]|nr:DUF1573 domain-containing protein [Chloroflexota bacterium]
MDAVPQDRFAAHAVDQAYSSHRENKAGLLGIVMVIIVLLTLAALAATILNMVLKLPQTPMMMIDESQVEHGDRVMSVFEVAPAIPPPTFPDARSSHPELDIPQRMHHLGRVASDGRAEHTFILQNKGDAPLAIRNLYTSCSYVYAQLTSATIAPGKMALLTVTFDGDHYHEATGVTIMRGIIIETDDPHQPESEVWVQAFITP